jgi:hypothetical protein
LALGPGSLVIIEGDENFFFSILLPESLYEIKYRRKIFEISPHPLPNRDKRRVRRNKMLEGNSQV